MVDLTSVASANGELVRRHAMDDDHDDDGDDVHFAAHKNDRHEEESLLTGGQ